MRFSLWKLLIVNALVLALAGFAKAQTGPQTSASGSTAKAATPKAGTSVKKKGRRSRKGAWKRKGQQVIKPERATEIQEALIREKYLTGQPTGKWDTRTQTAMVRYQADNGWQSKVTPDSRALIKLGLGPNYSQEQMLNAAPKSGAVAANGGGSSSASAPKR